jgi:cytochrome b6-f complex iron-sulfur subunit
MAETHKVVTKVWIAPGCIVCDACENDCPEVFDVQEQTCLIRPPAMKAEFLAPLTPSIQIAAEGCPVDVIKFDLKEVEGPAPWPKEGEGAPAGAPAAGGGAKVASHKPEPVMAPPDPKWQALLSTSKISPSVSAGLGTTVRKSPEVIQAEEMVRAVNLPKNAPPDQRAALLAAGGAYQAQPSLAQRLRNAAALKTTRRRFNGSLVLAWSMVAFASATAVAMFQDFFGPKVLKEPKKEYRVGRIEEYGNNDTVYDHKPIGFWIVNLKPAEDKLVALSIICTHLGCVPDWLSGDRKFKCPCHGSGYYITGVNFEGPTPRPLERFAVKKDPDGFVVVDESKVFRSELGEWDNPDSFIVI